MTRTMKIPMATLMLLAVVTLAGCTDLQQLFQNPTPTPAPTAEPTQQPMPTPIASRVPTLPPAVNQSVQQEYEYVEKMQAGIDHYNTGVAFMWDAHARVNSSHWINASLQILAAKDQMGIAGARFTEAEGLATNSQERELSQVWYNATNYAGISYQYASEAYLEAANQTGRDHPNWVRYNGIVQQVNYYNGLSARSRDQAEALASTMPLFKSA